MLLNFLFLLLLGPVLIYGQSKQVAVGEWRTHFSYTSATTVTKADNNKIYCGSPYSLFYAEEDGFKTLSKIDGLSEVGVSKVQYSDELQVLIIAYNNGNIDFIKNGEITNISEIYRKVIQGSKQINHIHFYKNLAYLSSDFGLVVIDCAKREIKETYGNLSPDGAVTRILATTTNNDSLFVATERGIITAPIRDEINLLDYKNWYSYILPVGTKFNRLLGICTLQNQVYAASDPEGVYRLNNKSWTLLPYFVNKPSSLSFITSTQGKIVGGGPNNLFVVTNESSVSLLPVSTSNAADATFDIDGHLWIADKESGLYTNKYTSQDKLQLHIPNGPYQSQAWTLSYFDGKIVGVPGGYSSNGATSNAIGGFYVFDSNRWHNFIVGYKFPVAAINFVDSYYNPFDKKLYFASLGGGLVTLSADSTYEKFDNKNSSLVEAYQDHPYVSSMEADARGSLWVVNSFLPFSNFSSVHRLPSDKKMVAVKSFGTEPGRALTQLVIDNNNYKWMRVIPEISGGMVVYDSDKDRFRFLSTGTGFGALPSNKIFALSIDKTGQMWVGTDKGVAVFYEPSRIFNSTGSDASQPRVNGFGLLFDQVITTIKVDGGNRKWIGTRNGLWLFNSDGTEAIEHFTTENSPLISNEIKDVEINEITGEVFISTPLGIMSYRGTATEGSEDFSRVVVYPNPVKPEFSGTIAITGLMDNAYVKITDMYGNLVHETRSQGGMATWNRRNYKGVHAKSGLYLVFSMSKTGEKKVLSKFTVIE